MGVLLWKSGFQSTQRKSWRGEELRAELRVPFCVRGRVMLGVRALETSYPPPPYMGHMRSGCKRRVSGLCDSGERPHHHQHETCWWDDLHHYHAKHRH